MTYDSFAFVAFLVATLGAYAVVPPRLRPGLLWLGSLVFYASGSSWRVVFLLAITAAAFWFGPVIERRRERGLLLFAIGAVLLPLLLLKYGPFVMGLIGADASAQASRGLGLGLPLGLSFYSLQAVSYLVDVHRGGTIAERRPLIFGLYLSFFPYVFAGPIERARAAIPQLLRLGPLSAEGVFIGAKTMLWGFFCKLALADNLGGIVDAVYGEAHRMSGLSLTSAAVLYSLQIYLDFYGYTNIAIGTARLFGVRLSPNFDNPYLARSIGDFWRRWHITLTSWFRDYVYKPLGGSRHGEARRLRNVFIVFILSGLWHGAALNFLLWGALHAAAYMASVGWERRRPATAPRGSRPLQVAATFAIVTALWIPFRIGSPEILRLVMGRILTPTSGYFSVAPELVSQPAVVFCLLALLGFVVASTGVAYRATSSIATSRRGLALELGLIDVLIVVLLLFGDTGGREFIYFNF